MKLRVVAACALLMCVGGLMIGGCSIAEFIAQAAFPKIIDAQYKPPKKQPMLVLVENLQNPDMGLAETDELTAYVIDDLKAYEVCPIIEPKVLQRFCDDNPHWAKLSISQLGKGVGAEQVLYVDLQHVGFNQVAGVPSSGRIDVTVHMVDVATSKTVFPKSMTDSLALSYETPLLVAKAPEIEAAQHSLLQAMGTTIGRLFHDYKP